MAIINLTNQTVLKTGIESAFNQMKEILREHADFLKNMDSKERVDLIMSNNLPVERLAWEVYTYLKTYFGDVPLAKMQVLAGLPVTRKKITIEEILK